MPIYKHMQTWEIDVKLYMMTMIMTYKNIYIHIHARTFTHTYTYMHIHAHTFTYAYMYIRSHAHTYTHPYTKMLHTQFTENFNVRSGKKYFSMYPEHSGSLTSQVRTQWFVNTSK